MVNDTIHGMEGGRSQVEYLISVKEYDLTPAEKSFLSDYHATQFFRCKDCRKYEPLNQSCIENDGIMLPNFYCGLWEKKDGEQE